MHYKRGRRYVHSPDLAYDEKMALIGQARALAHAEPKQYALLYQDELTYYVWPSVAQGYARAGSDKPHARQGLRSNRKRRIAGTLDMRTASVHLATRQVRPPHLDPLLQGLGRGVS
ncbi:MAG: hypothetical protein U0641_04155 [Anaerolineae bacterium]